MNLEIWGDWEASLSQFVTCDDQGASLPQSEWKVTKGLLYLGTWGDWEVFLFESWIATTKGLLYLNLNGR